VASEAPGAGSIKLDSTQREVLLAEIARVLAAPLPDKARAPYEQVRSCIEDGRDLPPDLDLHLSIVIESSIVNGTAKRYGAGVQQSMVALFQKTSRGKVIGDSINAINAALVKVNGHVIEQVSTTLRAPGSYALTLKTDQLQMVIILDRTGLSIESLEVNLG